ncbi:hypothetical protein BC829DRAFT_443985 [Chytridium lagenaria]|nr:hypothetical protein BC829DRAFT_443985 [Chytridium lagenaria]
MPSATTGSSSSSSSHLDTAIATTTATVHHYITVIATSVPTPPSSSIMDSKTTTSATSYLSTPPPPSTSIFSSMLFYTIVLSLFFISFLLIMSKVDAPSHLPSTSSSPPKKNMAHRVHSKSSTTLADHHKDLSSESSTLVETDDSSVDLDVDSAALLEEEVEELGVGVEVKEPSTLKKVGKRVSAMLTMNQSVSEAVTSAAVKAAVMLKQSPIPDQVASLTQATLIGYTRVDSAFGLQDRLVSLGQSIVRGGVVASGIAANAFIRAGVAYHTAPGYSPASKRRKPKKQPLLKPADRNTPLEASSFADEDDDDSDLNEEPTIKIIRIDLTPGAFPPPELCEASTQTDESISGTILPVPDPLVCNNPFLPTFSAPTPKTRFRSISDVAFSSPTASTLLLHKSPSSSHILSSSSSVSTHSSPTTDDPITTSTILQNHHLLHLQRLQLQAQLNAQSPSPQTLFSSIFETTTSVATKLLSSSSRYLLGDETVHKLLGDTPQPSLPALTKSSKPSSSSSPIRNVIVGGIYHATTLTTLLSIPNSRLAKWLKKSPSTPPSPSSSQTPPFHLSPDGTLFIDRDGTYFRHILNHLQIDERIAEMDGEVKWDAGRWGEDVIEEEEEEEDEAPLSAVEQMKILRRRSRRRSLGRDAGVNVGKGRDVDWGRFWRLELCLGLWLWCWGG